MIYERRDAQRLEAITAITTALQAINDACSEARVGATHEVSATTSMADTGEIEDSVNHLEALVVRVVSLRETQSSSQSAPQYTGPMKNILMLRHALANKPQTERYMATLRKLKSDLDQTMQTRGSQNTVLSQRGALLATALLELQAGADTTAEAMLTAFNECRAHRETLRAEPPSVHTRRQLQETDDTLSVWVAQATQHYPELLMTHTVAEVFTDGIHQMACAQRGLWRGDTALNEYTRFTPRQVLSHGGGRLVELRTDATGNTVVVKSYSLRDASERRKFYRRIAVADAQSDVALAQVLCACTTADTMFDYGHIVMAYYPGGSLSKWISTQKHDYASRGIPFAVCQRVACDLVKGLSALHERMLAHHDVKPDNVMMTARDCAVIGDLDGVRDVNFGLTTTMMATQNFLAPEVPAMYASNQQAQIDWRAVDVYATGLTLQELFAHSEASAEQAAITTVLERMISRDVESRPSMGEVLAVVLGGMEDVALRLCMKCNEMTTADLSLMCAEGHCVCAQCVVESLQNEAHDEFDNIACSIHHRGCVAQFTPVEYRAMSQPATTPPQPDDSYLVKLMNAIKEKINAIEADDVRKAFEAMLNVLDMVQTFSGVQVLNSQHRKMAK